MLVTENASRAAELRAALNQSILASDGAPTILAADGAMATMLLARRPSWVGPVEEMNLSLPALVRDVHREYLAAGAQILKTNTFGANKLRVGDRARAMNRAGLRIAREVGARENAFVAAALGPLGSRLEPLGPVSLEEARAVFREQASALAGADLFTLETFEDVDELHVAVEAVREATGGEAAIAAQITVNDNTPVEALAIGLEALGADLIGVNCGSGPYAVLRAIERLARVTSKPLIAVPSAGLPGAIVSPGYFAAQVRRMAEAGARIVGGCCGSTPEHIRAMKEELDGFEAPRRGDPVAIVAPEPSAPVAMASKSRMGAKLAAREFVTWVELPESSVEAAKACHEGGVDVVSVPAGGRSHGRTSPLSAAAVLHGRAGIGTLLTITCRNRTAAHLQAELLSADALGVHNILCLTGESAGPFDIDSIGLVTLAQRLNHGLDLYGNAIGKPTEFLIGAGVNPWAGDLDREIARAEAKARGGAEYLVTQPVFDVDAFEPFLRRIESLGLPVIASVWPIEEDARLADYIRHELRIPVPDPLPDFAALVRALRPMSGGLRVVAGAEIERAVDLARAVQE